MIILFLTLILKSLRNDFIIEGNNNSPLRINHLTIMSLSILAVSDLSTALVIFKKETNTLSDLMRALALVTIELNELPVVELLATS